MSELDNLIKESKTQQEMSATQASHQNMLRLLSNIAYYLGVILLPLSVFLFLIAASEGKDYIGSISIVCLLGGINSLFFGLVGKCLIDIYNKVSKDK